MGGSYVKIRWDPAPGAQYYNVYWYRLYTKTTQIEVWVGPVFMTGTYDDIPMYIEACDGTGRCIKGPTNLIQFYRC